MKDKYFKPKSLTWWGSVAMIAAGIFMSTEPMHGMAEVVSSIRNGYGLAPAALINAGLLGIGMRGAIK